jgi:hypothetical protein
MSKRELIDAIRQVNRTAAPEFLAMFQESQLKEYLMRVCAVAHTKRSGVQATLDGAQRLVLN